MREKGINNTRLGGKNVIKAIYVYIILLLVVAVLSLLKGELFQRGNFLYIASVTNLIRMSVPILLISSGFTFIMISGNIDLSVGSTLSLTTVFYSVLVLNGVSFLPAMLLTVVLGVVLGGINGWLVMKMRITPVIATLITMNVYQGIARYIVPEGVSAIKSGGDCVLPQYGRLQDHDAPSAEVQHKLRPGRFYRRETAAHQQIERQRHSRAFPSAYSISACAYTE
jgi:ribose/xylose/arabinose/galactoside ABC-type transport system permease subunit